MGFNQQIARQNNNWHRHDIIVLPNKGFVSRVGSHSPAWSVICEHEQVVRTELHVEVWDIKRPGAIENNCFLILRRFEIQSRKMNWRLKMFTLGGTGVWYFSSFSSQFPPMTLDVSALSPAASLRAELNHLHASSIEHLKQFHHKDSSSVKRDLENAMEHRHQQVSVLLSSLLVLFSAGSRLPSRRTSCIPSRSRSSLLESRSCKRSCVPVATASPIWTTRFTL